MGMDGEVFLEMRGIRKSFGQNEVLRGVDLEVRRGEILVLLGSSGGGKTVLMKHMAGLLQSDEGTVTLEGKLISGLSERELGWARRKVSMMFQGGALFGSMTLAENVALPMLEYTDLPKDVIARLVYMKLCQFDLAAYPDYTPAQLSGGMRKRAGLARAMALNPKLLFLDEPTSGLDPIKSTEINDLIQAINRNSQTTIIIVTHELDKIVAHIDRLILMHKGCLIRDGSPESLMEVIEDFGVRQPISYKSGMGFQSWLT